MKHGCCTEDVVRIDTSSLAAHGSVRSTATEAAAAHPVSEWSLDSQAWQWQVTNSSQHLLPEDDYLIIHDQWNVTVSIIIIIIIIIIIMNEKINVAFSPK